MSDSPNVEKKNINAECCDDPCDTNTCNTTPPVVKFVSECDGNYVISINGCEYTVNKKGCSTDWLCSSGSSGSGECWNNCNSYLRYAAIFLVIIIVIVGVAVMYSYYNRRNGRS